MRNILKSLTLLCTIAALCACDSGGDDPPEDGGGVFPEDGAGTSARCDGTDDGFCPCASAVNGGTRYLFCLDVVTWEQAREKCQSFGDDFVRIDSQAEQDFVWNAAVEAVGRQDWWIGLTDQRTEGEFLWADGSPLGGFAPWAEGQPDQGGAEEVIEEDCVELHEAEDGRWNDLGCQIDYLDYICEGPAR